MVKKILLMVRIPEKKKVLLLADYNGQEDPFDGRGLENVVFGIGNPKMCVVVCFGIGNPKICV
jgi:hypothetical protein